MENHNDSDNGDGGTRCSECHRQIRLGDDLIAVELGVLGPRGVVPLHDAQFFCSDKCVAARFGEQVDSANRTHLPRRIP